MNDSLRHFERFSRNAHQLDQSQTSVDGPGHPFDERNIHPGLPVAVRTLFDSGHYSQATFEAFKFIEKEVRRHGGLKKIGKDLMMQTFSESTPTVSLNALSNETELSEQEGYKFLFAGGVLAIRNPRGHEPDMVDDVDVCLDHVTFASMLLRRLADAGFHVQKIR
jgi:uncharacterized protein (TIGR02391 family)